MIRRNKALCKKLLGVLCFATVFVLLFLGVEALTHDGREYSGTWTRIRRENRVPEVLILGNSHAFCSFSPTILTQALGLDTAVLATSGLNSIGTTDSFEAALSVGAPRYIVVEANAYTFDYASTELYHKASALSNINGMPRLTDRVKSAWRQFGFESIPQGAFQLLRADLMWRRWKDAEPATAADGSSLLNWHATGVYDAHAMQQEALGYWRSATPFTDIDPRNEQQLRRLLALAEQHGVQVLLAKAPTEHQTQLGADILLYLDQIGREYGDTYLGLHDFHTDVADMGLIVSDFYDNSHLSRSGAAKLTIAFARWMGEAAGIAPDFSRVFAYAGETVEKNAEGLRRYTLHMLGEGAEYRFLLDGQEVQPWSPQPWVELPLKVPDADRVTVEVRRGDEGFSMNFMAPNTCIFS